MYIGDTNDGSGLHQMLWEVVANCVDEYLAGRCQRVDVVLERDGFVSVRDDGPGIPLHRVATGKRFAESVLTDFHTTATRDGHHPHAHVGLLGVGLAVVNALSDYLEVEVRRDGGRWTQRFTRGVPAIAFRRRGSSGRSGTLIRFRPDPGIFARIEMSYDLVKRRLAELTMLGPGLAFDLRDERRLKAALHSRAGLKDLLAVDRPWGADTATKTIRIHALVEQTRVEAALAWIDGGRSQVSSFVNMQRTRGGSHVEGLLDGVTDALQKAARPKRVPRRKARAVVEAGLGAVVHVVIHGDPRFGDPTRDRLDEPAVRRVVRAVVARQLRDAFIERPATWAMLERRLADS